MRKTQQIIAVLFILVTTMVSAQEPSLTLKGKVYDKENREGIKHAEIHLYGEKGNILKTAIANSKGEYYLEIEYEINLFKIKVKAKDYNQAEVLVNKSEIVKMVDFGLYRQLTTVLKTDLPIIYFDFNSSYLTKKGKEELKQVVFFMQNNPKVRIRVNAHTDSRGSNIYNNWLSNRRANRVKNWLIKEGEIEANRIEDIHFGETNLNNHCSDDVACTANQHRENRRCNLEIVIN